MQNVVKIMDRDEKDKSYKNKGVTLMGIYALQFIKEYVAKHDIPPTLREIHDFLSGKGYGRNPTGLDYAVKKLIASGKLEKRGATRNLYPIENKEQ